MIPWRPRRRAGLSLVEMIAAMMIFSVAVVAVLDVLAACLRGTSMSSSYTRAALLAQGLLEEQLAEVTLMPGEQSGEFGERFPDATWVCSITETDTPDLYQVHVTVRWPERDREREFELTTLAAER